MNEWDRTEMIGRVVNAYLGSVTGAREAYRNDAFYHERFEFMIRLLEIFDMAMEQEHLPTRTRYAVLERVMMAAPDPGESKRMLEQVKSLQIKMESQWFT